MNEVNNLCAAVAGRKILSYTERYTQDFVEDRSCLYATLSVIISDTSQSTILYCFLLFCNPLYLDLPNLHVSYLNEQKKNFPGEGYESQFHVLQHFNDKYSNYHFVHQRTIANHLWLNKNTKQEVTS